MPTRCLLAVIVVRWSRGRDYAVITTVLRLGLRASEVAGLRLDDIDWRAGELVVRGKGARSDRLPLPADVGRSIASYLQRGRPRSKRREVFLPFRHLPQRPVERRETTHKLDTRFATTGLIVRNTHCHRHLPLVHIDAGNPCEHNLHVNASCTRPPRCATRGAHEQIRNSDTRSQQQPGVPPGADSSVTLQYGP
jgi:integrase